ncbi:MAG: SpoIIE family protein phosphatase [Treponemataceae bacterium]
MSFLKNHLFVFFLTVLFCLTSNILNTQEIFWEYPVKASTSESFFPSRASNGSVGVVIWQQISYIDNRQGEIWISMQTSTGREWTEKEKVLGPFSFSGDVPSIATVAINSKGVIAIAVASAPHELSLYCSQDKGESFTQTLISSDSLSFIAPRMYITSKDEFFLFVSQGTEVDFKLMTTRSEDGKIWSPLDFFSPAQNLVRSFVPMLTSFEDKDIVAFQSVYITSRRFSYQLYSCISEDGGETWTDPFLVTEQPIEGNDFKSYHNQKPNLFYSNKQLYLAWERSSISSENAQIYFSALDSEGKFMGLPERISNGAGNSSDPIIFDYEKKIYVMLYEARRGKDTSTVFVLERDGLLWKEYRASKTNEDSSFSIPVSIGNSLHYFWIQKSSRSKQLLTRLSPDINADPPSLNPVNFVEGKRSLSEAVSVRLNFPDDASGYAGYAYVWSRDSESEPDTTTVFPLGNQVLTTRAIDDETLWYLKVKGIDKAGNWSQSKMIVYQRDITAPLRPIITPPLLDEDGFVRDNTFQLLWNPAPEDDDVENFTFSLQYMSVLPHSISENLLAKFTPRSPAGGLLTNKKNLMVENPDNGVWAFSVCAIDGVGNISQPAIVRLFSNKYIPYTTVTGIRSVVDDLGTTLITIQGKGFLTDGSISKIYFTQKGHATPDYILENENNQFKVISDVLIDFVILKDFDESLYDITLEHETRGLYTVVSPLDVKDYGTIKFGIFDGEYIPHITKVFSDFIYRLKVDMVFLIIVLILTIVGIILGINGLLSTKKTTESIQKEIIALFTGGNMANSIEEKEKTIEKLSHRGLSLKFKIMFFTSILVILVVLLVSAPLGLMMIQSQEETLAKSLKDRVSVLVDGIASGTRAYLPSQNVLELSFLPQQSQAIEEAFFATITGLPVHGKNVNLNYVWATNDPAISSKIDTEELSFGESYLTDSIMAAITESASQLNIKAVGTVGALAQEIARLTQEGLSLVSQTDTASVNRRAEIQLITRELNDRISADLNSLARSGFSSLPEYNEGVFDRENTNYTFYQPVLYRQGGEQNFVRGIILVNVSTEKLINQVDLARDRIIATAAVIALIATFIGAIASLIIASIIIIPIKKLAMHVALIRDTEDKEELAAYSINFKTKDEIGLLGEIVNDMTKGLVKASAAAKDLTVGKEIQKMFIPLETDSRGKKLTTGKLVTDNAEFFGYYEGAKGVSGDYFDFKKLDDRHYAIIKCDVAGKGVPASLIMVEVATLFLDYFRDWTIKTHGYNLSPFVSRVNDMLESRGFQGRFAAFSLCIFDTFTGEIHFCNAGDNFLHFYNAAARKKVVEHIKETAAAGVFPSSLVDMSGGFQMITRTLTKNDVLFMYTDGIEEAKRMFRNAKFETIKCQEEGFEQNTPHESHLVGEESEEMGADRVNKIIEAVFAREIYTLQKWHNPVAEVFEFDFTSCTGTVEDCIMALVAVEKIFRLYKTTRVTKHDRVLVDRKVDTYLRKHFIQYKDYCTHKQEHSEMQEYIWYTHMLEDPQYDDLTLLGIRKL